MKEQLNSTLDDLRQALRVRADVNADGKLDKKDIEQVVATFRNRIEASTTKRPWKVIAVFSAMSVVVTSMIWALFC